MIMNSRKKDGDRFEWERHLLDRIVDFHISTISKNCPASKDLDSWSQRWTEDRGGGFTLFCVFVKTIFLSVLKKLEVITFNFPIMADWM